MTPNDTETNTLTPEEEKQQALEKFQAIESLFNHLKSILTKSFSEYTIEGLIGQHPMYGPLFVLSLVREGKSYACGFFLNEVGRVFQTNGNPEQWLCSFYVDMIRSGENNPLPVSPKTEEESKALIDNKIVPYCIESIRNEFPQETMHVDLSLNEQLGPVLEAGFPSITDGSNTTGLPLAYIYALYLLNRDPAEPIIEALNHIYDKENSLNPEN
ncbi:MAG: hypothetical protein K6T85_14380 [Gorillibacterium sp.]|nr:hypothetical protein [Gorillibacterium sp.]